MAGQLGNERITVQNQMVYKTDYDRSLLYIKGGVPGKIGGLLMIKDAIKKHDQWKILPFPTFIPEEGKKYPSIQEYVPPEDLNEKYTHDNDEVLGASDEEEEGEEVTVEDENFKK